VEQSTHACHVALRQGQHADLQRPHLCATPLGEKALGEVALGETALGGGCWRRPYSAHLAQAGGGVVTPDEPLGAQQPRCGARQLLAWQDGGALCTPDGPASSNALLFVACSRVTQVNSSQDGRAER
jgi:hypothetical protein